MRLRLTDRGWTVLAGLVVSAAEILPATLERLWS